MGSLIGFASGLLFGLGLILAGMTNPAKVKAFLDLTGAWDPSLALVMGGAIALGIVLFARAARRRVAWSGAPMEIPTDRTIDRRLVLGGVLFGIGWGIGGFCPGPALVALGAELGSAQNNGLGSAAIFVAAMLAGMVLHDRFLVKG
jgi:uncharacterized membrane protein YedE/YeeE